MIHRQSVLYTQEYGWDWTYEALISRILGDFATNFDATREDGWIAERAGQIVGSIFLMRSDDPSVARLRLLYVEARIEFGWQERKGRPDKTHRPITLWRQPDGRLEWRAKGYRKPGPLYVLETLGAHPAPGRTSVRPSLAGKSAGGGGPPLPGDTDTPTGLRQVGPGCQDRVS